MQLVVESKHELERMQFKAPVTAVREQCAVQASRSSPKLFSSLLPPAPPRRGSVQLLLAPPFHYLRMGGMSLKASSASPMSLRLCLMGMYVTPSSWMAFSPARSQAEFSEQTIVSAH